MKTITKNGAEFLVLTYEEAEEMRRDGTLEALLKEFFGNEEQIAIHCIQPTGTESIH